MEELYPSEIQRKCKVSYVTSLAVKSLVNERVSQTLQEIRKEIEEMEPASWNSDGFQAMSKDQVLQVIDKHNDLVPTESQIQ